MKCHVFTHLLEFDASALSHMSYEFYVLPCLRLPPSHHVSLPHTVPFPFTLFFFFARHIYLPLPRCRYCCGSVAVDVVAFVSSTNKISAINIRLPMRQRVNVYAYVCVAVCVCAESYVLCLLPFFISSFAPFVLWLWVRAFVYIFASLRHFTTFSSFLWNLFSLPTQRRYPMNIYIQLSLVQFSSHSELCYHWAATCSARWLSDVCFSFICFRVLQCICSVWPEVLSQVEIILNLY